MEDFSLYFLGRLSSLRCDFIVFSLFYLGVCHLDNFPSCVQVVCNKVMFCWIWSIWIKKLHKGPVWLPSITQHPINSVIRKYKGQIVSAIVQSEMHLMYIIFISAILFVFFHCLKVISVVHYPTQKEHIFQK